MFDFLKDAAVQRILGSLVRTGLASLGGLLVEQGLATKVDVDEMAVRAAPILIAAALSIYQKHRQNQRERVALSLPGGTPQATLNDVMKNKAA